MADDFVYIWTNKKLNSQTQDNKNVCETLFFLIKKKTEVYNQAAVVYFSLVCVTVSDVTAKP